MKKISLLTLALAGFVLNTIASDANYAVRVVSYDPGVGYASGYTNVAAVLGAPSRVNPYGDAVEPFNPPYGTDQVLSIGEGGSLTVKFQRPVHKGPRNTYGLDFIIFGNSGFIVTNDFDLETFSWIGEPATDGSLFGANSGVTRISVSKDGRRFYPLDEALAPNLDVLFPTDGSGDFRIPVNPALSTADFAGATVADIRELYHGSAGGTGFDLAWANLRNQRLSSIRYVRIEVLSGKVEIDGFSAVKRHPRK